MDGLLSAATIGRIDELIDRWNLHDDSDISLPVPIQRVAHDEGWKIGWGCRWPLYGFAIYDHSTRVMRLNGPSVLMVLRSLREIAFKFIDR